MIIAMILGVLVGLAFAFCIQAAFLLLSAKICSISERSFGRALATAIIGGLASGGISGAVSALTDSVVLGPIAAFFMMAFILSKFFETTFGRAAAATIVLYICDILFFGAIFALIFLVAGSAALGLS